MTTYAPIYEPDEHTKMKPVFTSSDTAKSLADTKKSTVIGTAKYPWRYMEVGQSFHVTTGEATWTTISTSCYKWSKKLNRKFRAVNHGDAGIEVARLPMSVGNIGIEFEAIQPINSFFKKV